MFKHVIASVFIVTVFGACGSENTIHEFEPTVDENVNQGIESPTDGDASVTLSGDPCSTDNPWNCSPLADYSSLPPSSPGCDGENVACDYFEFMGVGSFDCLVDSTEPVGSACDDEKGPWCQAGSTCHKTESGIAGICVKYCCSVADCDVNENCIPVSIPIVEGPLGYCIVELVGPDAGAPQDAGLDSGAL